MRASKIIGDLLAPSRQLAHEGIVVALTIDLTRSEAMKNGVSVQTLFAESLPVVKADRTQLQQVILNLILNAIQAMVRAAWPCASRRSAPRRIRRITCSSRSGNPGRAYARKASSVFSIHFTQPSRPAWEWDWQSVVQLSKDTVGEYGRQRTCRGGAAFHFTLPAASEQTAVQISTTGRFVFDAARAEIAVIWPNPDLPQRQLLCPLLRGLCVAKLLLSDRS